MTVQGTLRLDRVMLRLRLGAGSQERITERNVPVDITWTGPHIDGSPLDYDRVCEALAGFKGSEFRMIEELASAVHRAVAEAFPDGHWTVSVRKPHPPSLLPMDRAVYTIEGNADA